MQNKDERITTGEARKLLEIVTPLAKALCFTQTEMCEILKICDKALEREIQSNTEKN